MKGLAAATLSKLRWPWKITLSLWVSTIDETCCTNILTDYVLAQTDLDFVSSIATCVDVCVCMHVSTVHPFCASEVLLNTGCPDCLVVHSNYTLGGSTYHGLQLLSKTRDIQTDKMNAEGSSHFYSQKNSQRVLREWLWNGFALTSESLHTLLNKGWTIWVKSCVTFPICNVLKYST